MKIRRGVTRTVLITKRYAIKVPRIKDCKGHRMWTWTRGLMANISEADWTEYAKSAYDTPQIAPVIKSFLWNVVNVYPRAEVIIDEELLDDVCDEIEFQTPSDRHVGNVGFLDGNAVWLDYDMNWNDCKRCGIDERFSAN